MYWKCILTPSLFKFVWKKIISEREKIRGLTRWISASDLYIQWRIYGGGMLGVSLFLLVILKHYVITLHFTIHILTSTFKKKKIVNTSLRIFIDLNLHSKWIATPDKNIWPANRKHSRTLDLPVRPRVNLAISINILSDSRITIYNVWKSICKRH